MKKALVTGITGQDGAYLSKFLLENGYRVYGTTRRLSSQNFWRIKELGVFGHKNFTLVDFDLTDATGAVRLMKEIHPDEVYNLAAQSFVGVSFSQPLTTAEITGMGPLHLLEAIRIVDPEIKFYQASTSELFGKVQEVPQTEKTPFYPRSPYGVAKLFAHWATINYRESYDIFGACGILFNHESPLRGLEFVTRKITSSVAKIKSGLTECIELGNLDAKRDWGFAGDYVVGMWKMLQQNCPDTYVLATGRTTTVRDFVRMTFDCVGMDVVFEGTGANEVGYERVTGRQLVRVNPEFYRPAEVDLLIGDATKAREELGWTPEVNLEKLTEMMVQTDLVRAKEGKLTF